MNTQTKIILAGLAAILILATLSLTAFPSSYYNSTRILSFYPQLQDQSFPSLAHFIPDCRFIHSWIPSRCLSHSNPT